MNTLGQVGMKVWSRFLGGEVFYPAKVAGIVERDGVVMSYKIHYNDGEVEKGVSRIR